MVATESFLKVKGEVFKFRGRYLKDTFSVGEVEGDGDGESDLK